MPAHIRLRDGVSFARLLGFALLTALVILAGLSSGAAARVILDPATGRPLSCPDPSVVDAHAGRYRYYLVCTSDYDSDAFPIRGSNDLVHWRSLGSVFPAGHQPWWALPSPTGRYWAPAIYRIGDHWSVYFAAQYNARRVHLELSGGGTLTPGTETLGVATAATLSGPWHSRLLHWRGQFNGVSRETENYGGVIDPSVVSDPHTGQRYLFWAEQASSIWVTRLSADGLRLDPHIHQALWVHRGWECAGGCTVEGPEEFYHRDRFYLLYSGASTWVGTYAVGVATSTDPLHGQFQRISPLPLLSSSRRWIGPGGTSRPVLGPDGRLWLLYHAMTGPDLQHISARRYLLESPLSWDDSLGPGLKIGDGLAR